MCPCYFAAVVVFLLASPYGGDEGNRTPDPLLAGQVLSQLSYTPISGVAVLQNRTTNDPVPDLVQSLGLSI